MNINKVYNQNAEISLLGEIFLNNDVILEIGDTVSSKDFYNNHHKIIFENMSNLYKEGKKIDMITLAEKLGASLGEVGGVTYLSQIFDSAVHCTNIKEYAEIIKEKSANRNLMRVINKAKADMEDEDKKSHEVVKWCEENFLKIHETPSSKDGDINEALTSVIEDMEKRYLKGGDISGVKTGYKSLDNALGGFSSDELIILAARPSMGKTAMAINLALNVAHDSRAGVAFFNLEMTREQVLKRAISKWTRVPFSSIRSSKLSDEEWLDVMQAADDISRMNFSVYDKVFTLSGIKRECKKLKMQKGLDVVIIDYLQLIDSEEKFQNRVQDIAKISRVLKLMAKELQVTVVALSQLSRAPEARLNHRPMLSDLRESGSLEQDADVVMFLYRDAYYNCDTDDRDVIETIIAKNRNGSVGTIKLKWQADIQRIG